MICVMRGKGIERHYLKQGKSWCSHTMFKLILKRQADRNGRPVSLCCFFCLISNSEERLKRREDKCYWTVWEGGRKKHKTSTRTESWEKEREGTIWAVMRTETCGERDERLREKEQQGETLSTMQKRLSKWCLSAVHSYTRHTAKVRESGKNKLSIKTKWEREKRRGVGKVGKKTMLRLSLGLLRGNDQTEFHISYWWAWRSLNPYLPSFLLQHSSAFSTFPLFSQFSSPAGSYCNWLSNSAASCTVCVTVYLLYAVDYCISLTLRDFMCML